MAYITFNGFNLRADNVVAVARYHGEKKNVLCVASTLINSQTAMGQFS